MLVSVSDTALEVNLLRYENKEMGKKYFRGYLIYSMLGLHTKCVCIIISVQGFINRHCSDIHN